MNFWCAYCRRFLREGPPYDDFSNSHGMCDPCARTGPELDAATQDKIQQLIFLHESLRKLGNDGDAQASIQLIEQGLAQGLRAVDLLIGSLGAAFNKIGKNSNNYSDKYDGFSLAGFCTSAIEAARKQLPLIDLAKSSVDVLLVATATNQHTIGVQLLELWLNAEGIPAQTVVNKSEKEILAATRQMRPKVVGFSIGDARQLNEIRAIAKQIKLQCAPPPLMLLGGYPVKMGFLTEEDVPELSLVMDESKLFLILKTHLSLRFLYDIKRTQLNSRGAGTP